MPGKSIFPVAADAPDCAGLRRDLAALANPEKALILARFFRTGPGEYGAGDRFLGIVVPEQRKIAKKYCRLPLAGCVELLDSGWHEERLTALLVMVAAYARGDAPERDDIFRTYLAHAARVNNWDLVDLSAPQIVGAHVAAGAAPLSLLRKLAASAVLWERRIAMIATFQCIKNGDPAPTLALAGHLVGDRHDLMHKAVGWMLREVGKRIDSGLLEEFLAVHAATMPRTALRYAIERLPETRRAYWMGVRRG